MSDMNGAPSGAGIGPEPLPPQLRFLKTLVTVLAATMIAGVITIVALLVIRLNAPAPLPLLPAAIHLPDGEKAEAVTFGPGWIAVVSDAGRIHIFDQPGGRLRQSLTVAPQAER